jgi:hypothetical protein
MNLADTSMACGYGLDVVGEAVMSRFRQGSQYLLPTEETIAVTEALAARYGLPRWQFTLSATAANGEAISGSPAPLPAATACWCSTASTTECSRRRATSRAMRA